MCVLLTHNALSSEPKSMVAAPEPVLAEKEPVRRDRSTPTVTSAEITSWRGAPSVNDPLNDVVILLVMRLQKNIIK